MEDKQIELVESTWKQVLPIKEKAAELFYNKLFDLDPEVKHLFKTDLKVQGGKLMQTINFAVESARNLGDAVPAVQELGLKHVGYGVEKEHYNTVAEALLWTLGQGLGEVFTDEVKQAWTVFYTSIANVMIDASSYD